MTRSPEGFHPAVTAWFSERFPTGPSAPQREGWPAIRSGHDVLVAAPTGTGKTLAGFLVAIDSLYRSYNDASSGGSEARGTTIVYVSPLKALAMDVHQNLERPLAEIARTACARGLAHPEISVAVRTGDTSASDRQKMTRNPPDILVTTPESLYLMLTAEKSRATLRHVSTIIVDEIHALARDKRGSHLALSLERLEALQSGERPQRVGLSATQKPIDSIASLLTGSGIARTPAQVVDCGHLRDAEVTLSLPATELDAVTSDGQFAEIIDAIAEQVRSHRTTLIFVNTRRLAERVAHLLAERLNPDSVSAHHGSLSRDRRLQVEARLRAGELSALVATASLELGIDIGPVDLACQIGSPRSIATFLQRVGRSNHSLSGRPQGILFPMTRDELVECCALLSAVRSGRLDAVCVPEAPLDVLAQQIVAEVASLPEGEAIREDALFDMFRRAHPYRSLARADFDTLISMLAEGIETGRGRCGAHLHRDGVNGLVRARRGARLTALTNGGAIPEVGDYRVVLEPSDTFLGTVNEDFAIESMVGDVFMLGTHAWQVRQVTQGTVRVADAGGRHPNVPFWLGEAPSRTVELSEEVSRLREELGLMLAKSDRPGAIAFVASTCGVDGAAAQQVVNYLAAGRAALGALPTQNRIVFERFFDESGGTQLVVHSPSGGRVNKALGLALRKRFCTTFDFELQAAATDDAVVLSLGPQHSFPLSDAPKLLRSTSAETVLTQAVLTSPMFTARWRWNLNRALVVRRFKGGTRHPLAIQRMEADDLMATVFPALAACQENVPAGPIPIPDHVIVRQTLDDCLNEAMDVSGLVGLVAAVERGDIECLFVESSEPSVLSHEILNARPYAFLDDAPLEERRSRAVALRRGLPVELPTMGLDPKALEEVCREVAARPRDAEELHDLLLSLVAMRPMPEWEPWFGALVATGRCLVVDSMWCAIERVGVWFDALSGSDDEACARVIRGHLDVVGPISVTELSVRTSLSEPRVAVGLGVLESEGFAMRIDGEPAQWCSRRVLARAHARARETRRSEVRAISQSDFLDFLAAWQHVVPDSQLEGRRGLAEVVDQLQGIEIAAGSWEKEIFAARVESYRPEWLDDLCLSGEVIWGRLGGSILREDDSPRRGSATPSRATPITFALREDSTWLLQAARWPGIEIARPDVGASAEIAELLARRGALFHSEVREALRRLPAEVEEGLWDLVARGLATADGFQAARSLLSSREIWQRRQRALRRGGPSARAAARLARSRSPGEGRWSLLPVAAAVDPGDADALAESVAEQLLVRWGVVFFDLYRKERFSLPWRDVLWALRRMEARGTALGGHFVTGVGGEHYAHPDAIGPLKKKALGDTFAKGRVDGLSLSARDPLRLAAAALDIRLAG